jgi:hypothetical protein
VTAGGAIAFPASGSDISTSISTLEIGRGFPTSKELWFSYIVDL